MMRMFLLFFGRGGVEISDVLLVQMMHEVEIQR